MNKFCLYADTAKDAPCIAIKTIKYSYLPDFIADKNRKDKKNFSVPLKISCLKLEKYKLTVDSFKCINCMFCVFGCIGNRVLISKEIHPLNFCVDVTSAQIMELEKELFPKLFKGEFIELPPVPFSNIQVEYKNFEDFTSVDETENIAVWGANALKFLSKSLEPRVSLEVGVDIKDRNRNGRLDISVFNTLDNFLFVAETKISFKAMVSESRFLSQMLAYESELERACNKKINRVKFLFVGGSESDLLPPSNPDCTGGNSSKYFYDILRKEGFFFVSANAVLALGLLKLFVSQEKYNLENLFPIMTNKKYVGLLSSGLVTADEKVIGLEGIMGDW